MTGCRVINAPRHNLVARGRRRPSTAKHSSRKLTNTRRPTPREAPSTHGRARSCAPGAASLRTPKTGHAAWRCSTGAVCPGWHSATHLYRAGSLPCPFRRRSTSQRGCCAAGLPGREAQWMTNRVMALPEAEPVTALARSSGREDCTACNEGRLTLSHSPQRPPARGVPSAPCGRRPRGQPSNLRQGGKGVSCGAAHGPLGNPTRPPRRGRRVTRCPR